ncbi:hypothetical protein ACOZ4Y_10395 [Komagataeibacter rhaeticus]
MGRIAGAAVSATAAPVLDGRSGQDARASSPCTLREDQPAAAPGRSGMVGACLPFCAVAL